MKRYIKAAISILTLTTGAISCSDRDIIRQLDDVGSYINEYPDSALSVLDSLYTTGMQGREANAQFALLYSMALDKSYIDATDDSLINIAVDWYRKHGTADERLKSYYYQGRVYQNSGDNEAAMGSFVRAEAASGNEKNETKGLLYTAMSGIYIQIFENYIITGLRSVTSLQEIPTNMQGQYCFQVTCTMLRRNPARP